ncbi:MAG: Asp-tRNA(Asn)/Glu-tRNA(Gln) amidotransferase subunit GatB [Candidatus Spechtbacterales bacterium]
MAKYKPTIGLEIHAQLKTRTKMFCDDLNDPFETHPNINVCPVCMGHPGTLPVPNKQAIEHVVRVGFALNSEISERSKFDRKNYFYPDLPKGYQISQYDIPFCKGGYLDIETPGEHLPAPSDLSARSAQAEAPARAEYAGGRQAGLPAPSDLSARSAQAEARQAGGEEFKRIEIERVHLEEDTGRLAHSEDGKETYVDFNRAGLPLMELVTKPVLNSAEEARKFAQELRLILRYLNASDADMEKGQMRVEVNISLSPEGQKELGTKVELKNLNSLRAVEDATAYEIKRQTELLENGEKVEQATRGWDEVKGETFTQRSKEEAHDYRYFPEPDIPPVVLTPEHGFDLEAIRASLPELPQAKKSRFIEQYNLNTETADIFITEYELANYYEGAVSEALRWGKDKNVKDEEKIVQLTTNYIVKNLRTLTSNSELPIGELKITAENFGELIGMIASNEISSSAAREVLEEMFTTGRDPSDIVEEKGLKQVSDESAVEKIIDEVISEQEKAVNDYKAGEDSALKFLVGQVMAKSKGSANPQVATELFKKKLG